VPYGDAAAVERQLEICDQVGIGVAAVMMEPIQGEAGAIVPPDDFWPRIRKATKDHGVLLIADEVQTGLGRTGKLWGVEHWGVEPDIIAIAKSLGGGVMPISSFASTEEIWQCMMYPNPFIHTTTTGGGALACSAAIASINVALRDDFPKQAQEKGDYFFKTLKELERNTQIFTITFPARVCSSGSTSRMPRLATKWRLVCSSAGSWLPVRSRAPTPSVLNPQLSLPMNRSMKFSIVWKTH
jgi:putrescine aminotransferase